MKAVVCRSHGPLGSLRWEALEPNALAWDEVRIEVHAAGVQVVFDPVGGDVFDEAVRTVGWSGRYPVLGFAAGRIPALRVDHALVKGYDLMGVRYDVWRDRCWPQARDNLERIIAGCSQRRLRPLVSRVEPLAHAVDALSAVSDRSRHRRAEGADS